MKYNPNTLRALADYCDGLGKLAVHVAHSGEELSLGTSIAVHAPEGIIGRLEDPHGDGWFFKPVSNKLEAKILGNISKVLGDDPGQLTQITTTSNLGEPQRVQAEFCRQR